MQIDIPKLSTGHEAVDLAFRIALGDFLGNIAPYQAGMLSEPEPCIMAGLDYPTPWTRDAAFNTWFAARWIAPEAAKNTLLSVLRCPEHLEIDGEYWDAILWVTGAWQYYLVSGDLAFLRDVAYPATVNSLAYFERTEWDAADGLFRGGACFQDGVSAYPDQFVNSYWFGGIIHCLLDRPDYLVGTGVGIPCKALSTNCLYLLAYRAQNRMEAVLHLPETAAAVQKAERLRTAIRRNFRLPERAAYRYLLDAGDPLPERQEGMGHAFVLLSGVAAGEEEARQLIADTHCTAHGLPCVWPTYERYQRLGPGKYGRQSGPIWPQANTVWVDALVRHGCFGKAVAELKMLADKAVRDLHFSEIFHPDTGEIYGGEQEFELHCRMATHPARRRQTWCATGFIHMVLRLLFGLEPREDGLAVQPPPLPLLSQDTVRLQQLRYRQCLVDLEVCYQQEAAAVWLNGQPAPTAFIPADATGRWQVKIHCKKS